MSLSSYAPTPPTAADCAYSVPLLRSNTACKVSHNPHTRWKCPRIFVCTKYPVSPNDNSYDFYRLTKTHEWKLYFWGRSTSVVALKPAQRQVTSL